MADEQQLTIAAYKDIFSVGNAKGQRVLKNLAIICVENREIFDRDSARLTDYNLGANSVYQHIKWMLKRKTEPKQEKVISERKIL